MGWNFLFVGGTSLCTRAYRPEERTRAQAAMEVCINITMTLTAFSSGALAATGAALLWLATRPRAVQPA